MIFENVDLANIFNLLPAGGGTIFSEAYYMGFRSTVGTYTINETTNAIALKYLTGESLHKKNIDFVGASSSVFQVTVSGVYKFSFFMVGMAQIQNVKIGNYTMVLLDEASNVIKRIPKIFTNSLKGNYYWGTCLIKAHHHFEANKNYSFRDFTDINSPITPIIYFKKYDESFSNFNTPTNLMSSFNMFLVKPD